MKSFISESLPSHLLQQYQQWMEWVRGMKEEKKSQPSKKPTLFSQRLNFKWSIHLCVVWWWFGVSFYYFCVIFLFHFIFFPTPNTYIDADILNPVCLVKLTQIGIEYWMTMLDAKMADKMNECLILAMSAAITFILEVYELGCSQTKSNPDKKWRYSIAGMGVNPKLCQAIGRINVHSK